MTLEQAITQIQKESDFLGFDFSRMVKTIERMPMAFPKKTLKALKVLQHVKLA